MGNPENENARLQQLDAMAHEAFSSFAVRQTPLATASLDERVTIYPADSEWPRWFEREAARLKSNLPGDLARDIQHIGSTAVPGLDAKPIIDVMIGLGDPARIAELIEGLGQAGYQSLGETGVAGRWYLRKRDPPQHYNIAVVAHDGGLWRLNLAIRDFLRADAEAARDYAAAKWRAVSDGADMLLAYSDAKRGIIEAIAAKAREV